VFDETRDVRVRRLLVEREAEMCELERDVRTQVLGRKPVQDLLVRPHDGFRPGSIGNRLAEERRVRVESGLVQAVQHGDALVERLAGDEARGSEAHPVSADDALERRAVGRPEDCGSRERHERCGQAGHAGREPTSRGSRAHHAVRGGFTRLTQR
jgi:hypothetical protein